MKKLMLLLLFLTACGQNKTIEKNVPGPPVVVDPGTDPGTDPDPADAISYQKMQGLMVSYCQSCHASASFMQSESALRASQAKAYLWSKRMPPANAGKALPDNIRTQMVSFFSGN